MGFVRAACNGTPPSFDFYIKHDFFLAGTIKP